MGQSTMRHFWAILTTVVPCERQVFLLRLHRRNYKYTRKRTLTVIKNEFLMVCLGSPKVNNAFEFGQFESSTTAWNKNDKLRSLIHGLNECN